MLLVSIILRIFLTGRRNPIIIIILILAQTLIICLIIWFYIKSAWLSFTLFLIFLGGIIVLFVYATRLAPNEKFNLTPNKILNQRIIIASVVLTILINLTYTAKQTIRNISLTEHLSSIFAAPLTPLILIIITYLLITLIVVVEIANKKEGPLRNIIK